MKMDDQHRVIIPQFIREALNINEGDYYYFCYEENNKFVLRKSYSNNLINKVRIDNKGRFYIPGSIVDIFENENIILYANVEKKNVGIVIFKKNT